VNGTPKSTNFQPVETVRPVPQAFLQLELGEPEAAFTISRQRITDLFEEENSASKVSLL